MPRLPALERWEPTAHGLHAAVRLLGAIRRLVRERVPSYLHLALRVERAGLSTETLPTGSSVRLDFGRAALVYICPAGEDHPLPLAGHSQRSLFEALLAEIRAHGDALATPAPGQPHVEAVMVDLASQSFVPGKPDDELTGDLLLEVEPATSAEYGEALYRVFTALTRFRARLEGPPTPAVIWPEHFDLSTLWFPTTDRSYNAPQMNFGFAPFDSVYPRPYLYAYAYPMPEGFEALQLPAPAIWNTAPWRGMVLHYDSLRETDDPEALVEATYEAVYRLLTPSFRLNDVERSWAVQPRKKGLEWAEWF